MLNIRVSLWCRCWCNINLDCSCCCWSLISGALSWHCLLFETPPQDPLLYSEWSTCANIIILVQNLMWSYCLDVEGDNDRVAGQPDHPLCRHLVPLRARLLLALRLWREGGSTSDQLSKTEQRKMLLVKSIVCWVKKICEDHFFRFPSPSPSCSLSLCSSCSWPRSSHPPPSPSPSLARWPPSSPSCLLITVTNQYLLFTMILVTFSVVVTIGVLNVNFRTPATHKMAPWVRKIFIDFLPRWQDKACSPFFVWNFVLGTFSSKDQSLMRRNQLTKKSSLQVLCG